MTANAPDSNIDWTLTTFEGAEVMSHSLLNGESAAALG